jgi:hypothetical protein
LKHKPCVDGVALTEKQQQMNQRENVLS